MNPVQTMFLNFAVNYLVKPALEKAIEQAILYVEDYYKESSDKMGKEKKAQVLSNISKLNPAFDNEIVKTAIGAFVEERVAGFKMSGRIK